MVETAEASVGSPSLWRNRGFLRLWVAQVVSNAGTSITNVALPLTAVLVLGATPAQMGLLGLAGSLPNLLFGMAAGVWVDRTRRRPILVGADLGRALLLGSIPAAAALGHVTFLQLWLVSFLAGSLTVFFQIASIAVLPSLVTRAQLVQANSALTVSDSVIAIAGPSAAGGLVQIVGAPRALIADAASYVLSALSLGGIGSAEPKAARKRGALAGEIAEGIRALLGTPLLRVLTATSSVGIFAGALQGTLLILYLSRGLALAPAAIGLALSCAGVGSLVGAACAGPVARGIGAGPTMIVGKALMLVGALLVALAGIAGGPLPWVVAGQTLAGIGTPMYFVTQISLRQALTSGHLLGSITAARRFILYSAAAAGAALAGVLGGTIGLRATLLVGAAALLLELALLVVSPVRRARG